MKHHSFFLAALVAMPMIAAAQVTPPVPTTPPAEPVVAVSPKPAIAPLPLKITPSPDVRILDLDEMRRASEEARWAAQDALRGIDFEKINRDAMLASEKAMRSIDFDKISRDAMLASEKAIRNIDFDKISRDAARASEDAMRGIDIARITDDALFAAKGQMIAPMPMIHPTPMVAPGFATTTKSFGPGQEFSTYTTTPGQNSYRWIQGDPADSTYQLARSAMSRYDYSRAATLFAEVQAKYPNYRNAATASYYEAFCRYRVGTVENLRQALKILESNSSRLSYSSQSSEATVLQGRVLRSLIDRKEPGAEGKLKDLYAKYPAASCDSEDTSIKSQVLNSLYQSDAEAATPWIKKYLEMRDQCTSRLRETALFLLANRPTDEKSAIIAGVARNDTVKSVRIAAIDLLAKMPGDVAVNTLQELMRDDDERIQRAAVRSLMRSDNTKARTALRSAMLDKRDAPESQRLEAIRSYDRENTSPEDAAYLRNLFNRKDESERVKEAVISTLSRVPSEENVTFLLNVAKNQNESSQIRAQALRYISRTTLSVDDLIKLYDASDSRSMRQSLVEALSNRHEEAALNKLLDIVKYSTDPEVRSYTIRNLLNKNDATVTAKVLDLISKKP